MKKRLLLLLSLIMIFSLGLILRPSFSIAYADETTSYNNFYFKSIDMDVTVSDDNSYLISKTMDVQFGTYNKGEHKGIIVRIPNTLTYVFDDDINRKQKYYCTITDIEANELYNHYVNDGYTYIELGTDKVVNDIYSISDESRLVRYTLKYRINVGHDFAKKYDLFAFNLMGDDEPVKTDNFSFKIHFPKSIDGVMPEFFGGESGSTEKRNVSYVFDESTLTLRSNTPMSFAKFEALTIRMKLANNYFNKAPDFHIGVEVGVIVASLVLTIVLVVVAIMKASKNRPVRVVEFYPPEGYTPCDCDYVINNSFSPKRLVSLILYWASKGVIKINNDSNQKPKSITKIRELDQSAKIYEKSLFKAFFKDGDTYMLDVVDYPLGETMNTCANDVKNLIGSRYNNSSKLSHFLMALISFIPLIIMMSCIFIRTKSQSGAIITLVGAIILSFCAMLLWGSTYFVEDSDKKFNVPRVFSIMITIVVILFVGIGVTNGYDLIYARFIALIPIVAYVIMGKNIFSLTSEMKSVYGRLWGFKHSITIMEKDRIEKLVREDPSYFYDVLPYAYALNVLDDFVKNFEKIYVPSGSNAYVTPMTAFYICNSLNRSFAMIPISTNGSKFGTGSNTGGFGGGFSGGGFGGGGTRGR